MQRHRSWIVVFAVSLATAFVTTDSSARQSAPVTGDQKTLVILADFTDQPMSCSAETIRSTMFGPTDSVDALFRDNSSGMVSFSGDVVGPYTLSRTSTDPCSLSALSMAAEASATAAGVNVSSYLRRVYVMPPNSCGAGGKGTVSGAPSQSWIFACNLPGVYAHNLGHNLGMAHSSSAAPLPDEEYGDPSDPMAFGSDRLPGFNAPHRHQLGWLSASGLQNVTTDTDVSIAPLGLDPAVVTAPQALRIWKPSTSEYYYVSYRRPVGFDRDTDTRFYDRISVHRYKGDGSSTNTFWVANLGDGQSYTDSVDGITVTVIGRNTDYATVRVRFSDPPACTPTAPSISAAPQIQTAPAGASLGYAISLTNQDSPSCAPSTFALSAMVPSGWNGSVSSTSVTVAPGATASATLTLVSASTAAAGAYTATVTASDAASAAHVGSVAVTYSVPVIQDTEPPSAPQALTGTVRSKRIELSWGASTDKSGVAGYRVWRNGALVSSATTTVWADPSAKAGVSYTYFVDAYDPAGNISSPSNSVTISLSNRRTR